MPDFGGKLRAARERRGISLRHIAATTKISVAALEALERNDVSRLPGGIFSRAIVRSYAIEVGLDPETTVHEFLDRFHSTPGAEVERHPPSVAQDADLEQQRHRAARVFLMALAAMLLVGAVVGLVVYQWRPEKEALMSAPQPVAAPALESTPQAPAAQVPAPSPGAVPAGEIRLEIHPAAPCWASVAVGGKTVLSRLIASGERETVTIRDSALLTVGDAAACTFSINGRLARPLGAAGQVRSARISHATIADYVN
jgi:cytoskeletal protein RodZ